MKPVPITVTGDSAMINGRSASSLNQFLGMLRDSEINIVFGYRGRIDDKNGISFNPEAVRFDGTKVSSLDELHNLMRKSGIEIRNGSVKFRKTAGEKLASNLGKMVGGR